MRSVRPGASTGSSVWSAANRRRDLAGRHRRLDDCLHESNRVLTRVEVHHRRSVVGLPENADVARDANDLGGDQLAEIDDHPLADRVVAAEVFVRHPTADDRDVRRAGTIRAIVERPAGDDRDAERAEVLPLDPRIWAKRRSLAVAGGRPSEDAVSLAPAGAAPWPETPRGRTRGQPFQQRAIERVDARGRS